MLSLDLASLVAGSGIRGQFEEKFKALLRDIEDASDEVICFIDELRELPPPSLPLGASIHSFQPFVDMLLNLGKAEGSVDAGQMIKPALARGVLHMVGATTRKIASKRITAIIPDLKRCIADEYRKTIAKDPALDRRFQPVQIEEPTVESTISILRGLKSRYEAHHGVEISDSALVTGSSRQDLPARTCCICSRHPQPLCTALDTSPTAIYLTRPSTW